MKLNENFLAQMREATELLRTSGPAAATAAIQRALNDSDDHVTSPADTPAPQAATIDINPLPEDLTATAGLNGNAFMDRLRRFAKMKRADLFTTLPIDDVDVHEGPSASPQLPGQFLAGSCTNAAGARAYKLYVPSSYKGEPLPMLVMLHGCKQNPADFAAGTGMNRLAEEHNCLVLYPAQAAKANGSNCWNWFNQSDQKRDRGEPSILADMTRQVMREYRVDADRVYVAGLSAGGAMAAILGEAYPDLYAAVGIHSGLPVGSAQDVASAFAAMKSAKAGLAPYQRPVPAIIFHGDRDHTVHHGNGANVLAQCMGLRDGEGASSARKTSTKGESAQGRTYTQTVYQGTDGQSIAEHWVIHGAAHAWAGGSKAGSYTDPKGPDASAEMIRFFYSHPRQDARQ